MVVLMVVVALLVVVGGPGRLPLPPATAGLTDGLTAAGADPGQYGEKGS